MNLIYSQSLGQFRKDTAGIISFPDGAWYAGGDMGQHPEAVNNPDYQNIRCQGPIPQGWYTLGPPYKETELGPAMFLKPDTGNWMYGRSGFFIHCINPHRDAGEAPYPPKPGRNSSDGCPAATTLLEWEKIADLQKSGYKRLQVIA